MKQHLVGGMTLSSLRVEAQESVVEFGAHCSTSPKMGVFSELFFLVHRVLFMSVFVIRGMNRA